MTRRLIQLFIGLVLYGLSIALIVRADLGLDPWDVLNQGVFERLAKPSGVSFGLVVNLIGMAVLLLWIPLRQKPGIGTVANVLVIGMVANFGLDWIPSDLGLPLRAGLLVAGIVLNGVASGAYLGAGLGPGPRDGLMTGLARRTGGSIRRVRTLIELGVLAIGIVLGGTAGVGTVVFALGVGPITQFFLKHLVVRLDPAGGALPDAEA